MEWNGSTVPIKTGYFANRIIYCDWFIDVFIFKYIPLIRGKLKKKETIKGGAGEHIIFEDFKFVSETFSVL